MLVAAWVVLGLFGHDPWKPDEAYSFGLVYSILENGDWVVPTLAGQPFMEKPPLYYATAAVFARLFGWLLPLHDAARLASAFYVALTLVFVARLARSRHAALLLVACVGYVHHAHLLLTDNALMAGMAVALYGLSLRNGWLLGTGAGIAFLSKGLLGPGLLGLIAIALLAFPAWRSRGYVKSWIPAAIAFAPWLVVWPWLLYRRSPELFHEWLWVQNFGRFSGEVAIGGVADPLHYLKALPWFAFPAWPFAAWTVWRDRRALGSRPELQLLVTAFIVMFAVLSASSAARQLYALPMLLPLAALAAAAVDAAPRPLAWSMDKLAVWGGAAAGLALWGIWLAHLAGRFPQADYPGFVQSVHSVYLPLAFLLSAGWFFFVRDRNVAMRWAASATLAWGLASTLWMPWLDYSKTYRGMIAEMQKARPKLEGCVASRDLGEPQRALFHYFAGIVSVPEGSPAAQDCRLLLVQAGRDPGVPPYTPDWKLVWGGIRPAEYSEHYWLFIRR
ncbi:MAG: ArnT family glycosyltransferase [Betaproteobacteria bacterium]